MRPPEKWWGRVLDADTWPEIAAWAIREARDDLSHAVHERDDSDPFGFCPVCAAEDIDCECNAVVSWLSDYVADLDPAPTPE